MCGMCGGHIPTYGDSKEVCNTCYKREYARNWRTKNRDRDRESQRRSDTSLRGRYKVVRTSAKQRGHEFRLPFEEYCAIVANPCYYCNGMLPPKGGGLDRMDNSKGYTKDNVVPACKACNVVRSCYLTVAEMKVAMEAVMNFRKFPVPVKDSIL